MSTWMRFALLIIAPMAFACAALFGMLCLSCATGLSLLSVPQAEAGAVFGGPREAPGTRHEVTAANLAAPVVDMRIWNGPRPIERAPHDTLLVPPGFTAQVFAEDLLSPRWLAVAPNGDVFVSESAEGQIRVLRDADADGRADLSEIYARGFALPHGLAFQPGFLYVADTEAVWRFAYADGDMRGAAREQVTPPGALGRVRNHWTRNIVFAPDGQSFLVAVGSRGNIQLELSPSATIQRFRTDGSGQTKFAGGLRNPVGVAFYPGTDELYAVVNERDARGERLVPDYLTRVGQGDFFGWPFAYIGRNCEPIYGLLRPDLVLRSKNPDLLFEAHSAPLGLVFYDADQFPEAYRGGAFVALHGSWNRSRPAGYSIVYAPFAEGGPQGHYTTFASGFWVRGDSPPEVMGRPVGLAIAKDGSLLAADDVANVVWRISYDAESATRETGGQ